MWPINGTPNASPSRPARPVWTRSIRDPPHAVRRRPLACLFVRAAPPRRALDDLHIRGVRLRRRWLDLLNREVRVEASVIRVQQRAPASVECELHRGGASVDPSPSVGSLTGGVRPSDAKTLALYGASANSAAATPAGFSSGSP